MFFTVWRHTVSFHNPSIWRCPFTTPAPHCVASHLPHHTMSLQNPSTTPCSSLPCTTLYVPDTPAAQYVPTLRATSKALHLPAIDPVEQTPPTSIYCSNNKNTVTTTTLYGTLHEHQEEVLEVYQVRTATATLSSWSSWSSKYQSRTYIIAAGITCCSYNGVTRTETTSREL